ncbi:hypothetical protein JHK84_055506 [Glycine max]|uniref:RRM domain-containing protein n=1 Tax=Glycine max TaxID=3847 RepID=K7N214_SOYBN|nr:hypothetical protein JHK86_055466 [Glycine max]KAG4918198.1 hypothetical protein JHK85_056479 [Glycine max]KAG5074275.1 hypothetical protein JHK84_055506 [Glycine max]KAH1034960.1 hypothetical protein GYH30_055089 [Glycine max]
MSEREKESGRDRESEREGENGWVRVKHRNQTKERDSEKVREDPHRRQAENRHGQGQSYSRANWRSRKNITSFYFTRFPDDATEKELWHHFKAFGAVREIFISKNRNKHGRRFGFVKFEGVENAQKLEWKLDNIIFGGLKMHVNTPKFGRNKVTKPISEANKVRHDVHKEEAVSLCTAYLDYAPWVVCGGSSEN